jgi:hypothetical protein
MRFQQLETMRDAGFYVSDIGQALQYRPELFGGPFSELLQTMMRGPSEWTVGERELFAAFSSSLRQCPF